MAGTWYTHLNAEPLAMLTKGVTCAYTVTWCTSLNAEPKPSNKRASQGMVQLPWQATLELK